MLGTLSFLGPDIASEQEISFTWQEQLGLSRPALLHVLVAPGRQAILDADWSEAHLDWHSEALDWAKASDLSEATDCSEAYDWAEAGNVCWQALGAEGLKRSRKYGCPLLFIPSHSDLGGTFVIMVARFGQWTLIFCNQNAKVSSYNNLSDHSSYKGIQYLTVPGWVWFWI